jgi:hypothetical protein
MGTAEKENGKNEAEEGNETTVKCVASPCVHWAPGDRCGAAAIDVRDEKGTKTIKPEETECHTFALREGLSSMVSAADNVNWGGMAVEMFKSGQQLKPGITCSVDDCKYWATGNQCHAEAIEVAGRDASQCPDTSCATFER